jgi:chorismate mutase
MPVRGVRGAAVAAVDQPQAVQTATRELLLAILTSNPALHPADIASALFTVTHDLVSTYPAEAARKLGWVNVPLMCALEIPVQHGLPRCIRILLHWNTELPQDEIHHVYLGEAARLRPDLTESPSSKPVETANKQNAPHQGGKQ